MRKASVRAEPHLPHARSLTLRVESGLRNESSRPEFALIGFCTSGREDDNQNAHDRSVYDGK
jgi:hypothetical protein